MADFEADRGEFEGWKKKMPKERKNLLRNLLNLMAENVTGYVGTLADVDRPGSSTRAEYRKLVVDTLRGIVRDPDFKKDTTIAIVFARHNDFSADHAEGYKALLDHRDSFFGPITVDDPACNLPLQAADIFAYELQHHLRFTGHQRYPFTFLVESARDHGGFVRINLFPETPAELERPPARPRRGSPTPRSRGRSR